MPTDSKVTVESTYQNPIPFGEIQRFVSDVGHYIGDDAEVRILKTPETGHPTDPGGDITIRANGSSRTHTQEGNLR